MRLPLKVYFFAGGLRAMARFFLQSKYPHIFFLFNAILDTGSPDTIISNSDLKRARVSPLQLKKLIGKTKEINYGGGTIKARILENARLTFGNNIPFTMSVLLATEGVGKVPQPSVLGVDFLLENRFKLFFDPTNKIAYLENDN